MHFMYRSRFRISVCFDVSSILDFQGSVVAYEYFTAELLANVSLVMFLPDQLKPLFCRLASGLQGTKPCRLSCSTLRS